MWIAKYPRILVNPLQRNIKKNSQVFEVSKKKDIIRNIKKKCVVRGVTPLG